MKLSVFLVTYNQERYIRKALDSILMQEVDFDYEVIIGEDCSTDSTPQICDEYATKYPFVKVYHHKKNLGLLGNWEFVWNHCTGEYIAMLEGDDYWIDSKKLQKQVDFLDVHPEYALTFTSADVKIEEGGAPGAEQSLKSIREGNYTEDDLFDGKLSVLTSTIVCRNCIQPIHYDMRLLYADHYTFVRLFRNGLGYGFSQQMSVYRVHAKNLSRDNEAYCHGNFWEKRYLKTIFPEHKLYYQKSEDQCLAHLIYDKHDGWKYRLIKMWQEPRLIFSKFMLTTIKDYLL